MPNLDPATPLRPAALCSRLVRPPGQVRHALTLGYAVSLATRRAVETGHRHRVRLDPEPLPGCLVFTVEPVEPVEVGR